MLLTSKIGLYNIAMDLGTNILKLCILFEALKIVTKQNYSAGRYGCIEDEL